MTPKTKPDLNPLDFSPDHEDEAPPGFPILNDQALYGIAGEFTRAATESSEADPAAVLATFLVWAGALIGPNVFIKVGPIRHTPRLFVAIVAASSKGRKGTSAAPVLDFNEQLAWTPALNLNNGPMSSGEGLIFAVRDQSDEQDKQGKTVDEGVADKRLLLIEGEFGAPLKTFKRDGNTLSAVLRSAWDHGNISPLTKRDRIKTSGAHICIVGHITRKELSHLLEGTEVFNGFANRFLWICARRQKLVPRPKEMNEFVYKQLVKKFRQLVEHSTKLSCIEFTENAGRMWDDIYTKKLSADAPGVLGVVTARAEPQTLRLALIYALLDGATAIDTEHLTAALAFWDYCFHSAAFIFGSPATDPNAEKILNSLKDAPLNPESKIREKSQTELHSLFANKISGKELGSILSDLESLGRISQRKEDKAPGQGRAKTLWSLKS